MASWIDVFSLVMTTFFFVGTILGVLYTVHAISSRFQSMKGSLEHRGITISRNGVTIKTEHHLDKDALLDATQRTFVKVLNVATVGPESHKHALLSHSHSDPTLPSNLGDTHEKHALGAALRRSHTNGHGEGRH